MSITFGGQSHQYSGSPTENISSETFSVLETFPNFTPTRADNGQNLSCTVGHQTLGSQKLSTSVAISVQCKYKLFK
ncbi:hypothetical protein DPMN_136260 [Dreissena polymorpha]|uniref:Uncharacterized protein n=1 Tax=Dreissena polymorpha TaxID=45954 RepID=A0A9D4G0J8_DREPO|nr:hypothetical protein DPMN_136260 [Dreissena polymorpha]